MSRPPKNVHRTDLTPKEMGLTVYRTPAGNSVSSAELRRITGQPKNPRRPAQTQRKKRVSLTR